MKKYNFIKLTAMAVFAFAAIIGTTGVSFAQDRRNDDRREDRKDDRNDRKRSDREDKARAKAEQARLALERQRQVEWTRYNNQIRMNQQREAARNNRNNNQSGSVFVWGSANNNRNANYRVYRNGSYYQTNYRGAELLQQAVNEGYRQGFASGRRDRNSNRRGNWSNDSVYRNGSVGYQSQVDRRQYQYYFQQGFQRGYQDGSNTRYANDYNGQYEYGYYENGNVNILGAILNTVLNIRSN